MSQILITGDVRYLPIFPEDTNNSLASLTLDATGETCYMIGEVELENPSGSSKTISAAGGGSITWFTGAVTFANAANTFEVGIQDVSTVTAPAQGDGIFDVKATFTGGGGGITANAVQTSVMTSGTKTIANRDKIAITFKMTTMAAGADSVIVKTQSSKLWLFPCVTSNTTGSFSAFSGNPNALITFDDGTRGWLYLSTFRTASLNGFIYNISTSGADEYGNVLNNGATFKADGISVLASIDATQVSDFELILYSDPFGTPVVERTVTVDATILAAPSVGRFVHCTFSSPFILKPNTDYAITCRPTTTTGVTTYYVDSISSASGSGSPNQHSFAVRRLDNTGAFSDWNGGTAKTRLVLIRLFGQYLEQGVNNSTSHIGI